MADLEFQNLPLKGKLIVQKITENESNLTVIVQKIKKCEGSRLDITNLRNDARKAMQAIKLELEHLSEMLEVEDTGRIATCIEEAISKHKKAQMNLQVSLRKAYLIAEEKLSSSHRNELFSNENKEVSENSNIHRRKKSQEKAAKVSSNITANLLKIAEMMNSQVEHNIESTKVLEESSNQLQETQEELKGMAGVIQMSKKLINKYSRRELTDTLLIFFGLVLFFSTAIYIVLKRI
eukprot:gene7877-13759_t